MSDVTYAVQGLNKTIQQFETNVDVHVENIHQSSVSVQAATESIYTQIREFREKMELGEENQIAHENIIRIDQVIAEKFKDYETIRKTVLGIVRDFDINLVRNSTIQELTDELWITSSRYWLSYALIAITAWVNDYPDVARDALAESGRKDAIKTTLFFCLLNLRFDRTEVSKRWFQEYLKTLNPNMLQQESEVMIQAFLDGLFGKDLELEQTVLEVIDQWIAVINEDADICEELVMRYEKYLENLNPDIPFQYEAIRAFCTNANAVAQSFHEVSKYDVVLQLLKALDVDAVEQNDENYKQRVDAVLMNLISNFDEEEQELRNEQEYYRLVVQNKGAVAIAQEQHKQEMETQQKSYNIGNQMISWAVYDETTNERVRKFGFQNTKSWFKVALDRFAIKTEQSFPIEYGLAIDTWTGTSNGHDQVEVMQNMHNYYETHKFQHMFINTPNIAAAVIFILSLALIFVSLFAIVPAIGAIAFLGYRCYKATVDYPQRVANSMNALNRTLTEIAAFRQYFEENSRKKETVLSEIEFI